MKATIFKLKMLKGQEIYFEELDQTLKRNRHEKEKDLKHDIIEQDTINIDKQSLENIDN